MRHKAKTLQNLFSGRTGKENILSYTRYKEALLIVFVHESIRINDTCPGPIYNWDNHDYEYYANQYQDRLYYYETDRGQAGERGSGLIELNYL